MNDLEVYFQNEYRQDSKELDEIDGVLKKVLPIFVHGFDHDEDAWPYSLLSNQPVKAPKNYSTSTNSMILVMMRLAENMVDRNHLFPSISGEEILSLAKINGASDWNNTKAKAEEKYINTVYPSAMGKDKNKVLFYSDTYGVNDPLSLLWCTELVRHSSDPEKAALIRDEIGKIVETKKPLICSKDILEFYSLEIKPESVKPAKNELDSALIPDKYRHVFEIQKPELNEHSFISLRFWQLLNLIGVDELPTDKAFKFFESRLHLHLSYSDIPDSRFDPAELVFSLEGALRTKRNAVSSETIERAFQVLEEVQNLTPYWRPINPIYATAQGQVLLPLSVEIANSLLRICSILKSTNFSKESIFSKHSGMFKRYFRWLEAQIRQIKVDGIDCWGWASEHVGGDDEVHLFQTSEISSFLINYRHMLQERIAGRSLDASGLKTGSPEREKEYEELSGWEYWEKEVVPYFEPLLELQDDCRYKLYTRIGEKFIEPRVLGKKPEGYSILLYGPPGTGKSTVGENIAKALGWDFVTVTPSDFLAGGSGEVEARAKRIFNCLEEQKKAVILFDEIDQFLLDRESNEYKNQTGIFQFMTPGMLPKINELRKKERSIFIIATNYEDRIDPAIKRAGRIDLKLPLMPPAFLQRRRIVERESLSLEPGDSHLAGCTFTDLIGEGVPSLTSSQYVSRFNEKDSGGEGRQKEKAKTPFVEFLLLSLIEAQEFPSDHISEQRGFKIDINSDRLGALKTTIAGCNASEIAELKKLINDDAINALFEEIISS